MTFRLKEIVTFWKSVMSVPNDADLLKAELTAFTKQVPLMYVLVMMNMMALAVTHYDVAPRLLTLYIPAALDVVCIIRMAVWWRSRTINWTAEQATKRLKGTVLTAGILGCCFTGWSLSLFPYGDAYAQGHVAFFMAVTSIGCAFCLAHLRAAMLLIMAIVAIPFVAYLWSTGNPTLILISINFALVAVAVVFMLLVSYKEFERLIEYQTALRINQSKLQTLSDQNFTYSNIDILTSLPNRRRFFTEIEKRVEIARTDGNKLALGIFDLDGFKPVNDIYGHSTGDRLLKAVGERLTATLDSGVFLARIGGDEFVVIAQFVHMQEVIDLGEFIKCALTTPFELDRSTVSIGCTVGFACFSQPAISATQLFEHADYALYFAKHRDRGTVAIYDTKLETEMYRANEASHALATANIESEFSLFYQPIVHAKTRVPIAFEALARWRSPLLGDVSPALFIPAAERSGLISRLTPVLLKKALRDASRWPQDIRLSFNLSAVDISSPLAIANIISTLGKDTFSPSRIDFEVTETATMRDVKQASVALTALRKTGARVALDDFGTGYSSLSSIRDLPLDEIKIDRSFAGGMGHNASSQTLLKAIIRLCRTLNLDCVVEGVEREDQMAVLKDESCHFIQGYLFGQPMPAEDVITFLESKTSVGKTLATSMTRQVAVNAT